MGKKRPRSSSESKTDRRGSDGESEKERPAPVRHSEEDQEVKKVSKMNLLAKSNLIRNLM